jgi:AAA domain
MLDTTPATSIASLHVIGAEERLAEARGAKILIAGPTGVGKTSLLRTLDPDGVLFLDIEAGDLAVQDVAVDTIRIEDWPSARDLACLIGGPNRSFAPSCCYSELHHQSVLASLGVDQPLAHVNHYHTLFVDSLTALSRLSFRWAEQQPEAFSERTGQKDLRGAYGLHAREMINWLNQLQHARERNVIFIAILERANDDFGRPELQVQMEGSKPGRELPGIVDQIVTMSFIDFGDGKPVRAFVCTQPNAWGYPAKDRSGRLEQIEEPDLSKLIRKLTK